MLDLIHGRIHRAAPPAYDALTILVGDVGKLGYVVHVSPALVKTLDAEKADEVWLWLHHTINADQGEEKLYGFLALGERAAFRSLLKINGIGPALAFKILGGTTVADLAKLVGEKNVRGLKALPGIGPKMAERLVTELRL
jgi:Holliday junction DNA helicase RuvA